MSYDVKTFQKQLTNLVNFHRIDTMINLPGYVIANMLCDILFNEQFLAAQRNNMFMPIHEHPADCSHYHSPTTGV